MSEIVALSNEQISTAMLLRDQYQRALARLEMARELEAAYMEQLREGYALGPEWVCRDLLTGFVRAAEGDDDGSQNHP